MQVESLFMETILNTLSEKQIRSQFQLPLNGFNYFSLNTIREKVAAFSPLNEWLWIARDF
jgi:hypothetical protein